MFCSNYQTRSTSPPNLKNENRQAKETTPIDDARSPCLGCHRSSLGCRGKTRWPPQRKIDFTKAKHLCIDAFRVATPTDADAITQMVNNAYRPKSESAGWNHEADLVSGKRINNMQVKDIISRTDSIILLGCKKSEIISCVHIEKAGTSSFIGLLAVNALLQSIGVSNQMLAHGKTSPAKVSAPINL